MTRRDQATIAFHTGSNRDRNREGDSMSSKAQQTKGQQTNQTTHQPPETHSRHTVELSGTKGDNPATTSPGPTKAKSSTPENDLGHINPSAPEDANTTPGSTREK
jgi:hypothetical protein